MQLLTPTIVLVISTLFFVEGVSALPSADAEAQVPQRTRVIPEITRPIFRAFNSAQRNIDRRKFDKAETKLVKVLENPKLNEQEIALANNMLGYIYFETDRRQQSAIAYKNVLGFRDSISEGLELGVLQTLAKLAFTFEDYDTAISYTREWNLVSQQEYAEISSIRAMAHFKLNQHDSAIASFTEALALQQSNGIQPKENWLELITYLYFEKKDWKNYIHYQELMVKWYPSEKRWENLANAYTNDRDPAAAAETRKRGGLPERSE